MAIFQQLNGAGKTIVLITHEPDVASFARRTDGSPPAAIRLILSRPVARVRGDRQECLSHTGVAQTLLSVPVLTAA